MRIQPGTTYRVYAKGPGARRFSPLGKDGALVGNLIYASLYPIETQELADSFATWIEGLRADNPDWEIEARPVVQKKGRAA